MTTLSPALRQAIDEALAEGTTKEEILRSLMWRAMNRPAMLVYNEVKNYLASLPA